MRWKGLTLGVLLAIGCAPEVQVVESSGTGASSSGAGGYSSGTGGSSSASSSNGTGGSSSASSSSASSASGTGSCVPGGAPPTAWEAFEFASYQAATPCAGARYVRYMDKYGLWVGAVLCQPTRYKLFLSRSKSDTFYQIGDFAGYGQDHCELVNDAFSIPNEDDITSGGCSACAMGPITLGDSGLGSGFSRATFGSCFDFEASWPMYNLHSTQWYECGVSIP